MPGLGSAKYDVVSPVRVSDFDYELPPDRIAQYPADRRDESRLLELDRASGRTTHRVFTDIVDLLAPGDALVLNDTRVIPARLIGRRPTGGEAEVLLLEPLSPGRWQALVRPGRRLREGAVVEVADGRLTATIEGLGEDGTRIVALEHEGDLLPLLEEIGRPPLPPYIDREAEEADRDRYQTVYAHTPGAVAAPTAGLHFTPALLDEIRTRGVSVGAITLHVGLGTFRPVRADRVEDHVMHEERFEVPEQVATQVNDRSGRLVAVGTTVTRALESVADEDGRIRPGRGSTDLFIYPGYRFRAVEALLTNFHLPRSTLIMMVSAFTGRQRIMRAYREAIDEGYRFYSYGDAMFIH